MRPTTDPSIETPEVSVLAAPPSTLKSVESGYSSDRSRA